MRSLNETMPKPNPHLEAARNSYRWACDYYHENRVDEARKQLTQAVGLYTLAKDKAGVKKAEAALLRLPANAK